MKKLRSILTKMKEENYSSDAQYYTEMMADWDDKSNCACNVAYFPTGGFHVIEHWKVGILRPLIVNICFPLSFAVLIYDGYNTIDRFYELLSFFLVSFLIFISMLFSYWMIIIRGPGYLPCNWYSQQRKTYTWQEMMNHMAIYKEQITFAKQQPRPPRSSFSVEARRIVLRADHFCIWTHSWIGIMNYRYFVLFTLNCFLYGLSWFGFHFRWCLTAFRPFKWMQAITVATSAAVLFSTAFSAKYLFISLCNMQKNQTIVEKHLHKSTEEFNRGCVRNYEEVCGPLSTILCWANPFACLEPAQDGFYSDISQSFML